MASAPTKPPNCPRCGYDQSGMLAHVWPLEWTCSECGLGLSARELFRPKPPPRELVEHVRTRWIVPALAWTLVVAILAPLLWFRVRMHHEIRAWRLCVLVATAGLLVFCVFAVRVGHAAWLPARGQVAARLTLPSGQFVVPFEPPSPWEEVRIATSAATRPFDDTPHRLVRVVPMDSSGIPMLPIAGGPPSMRRQFYSPAPLPPDHPPYAVRPLPGETAVVGTWLAGTPGVPKRYATSYPIFSVPSRLWSDVVGSLVPTLVVLSAVAACASALSFVFLPVTRRRAGVRWEHTVRGMAYLLATLPWVAVAFVFIRGGTPLRSGGIAGAALSHIDVDIVVIWALWLIPWWSSTARQYLRLPHALGISIAVSTIGALAAVLVLAAFDA